MAGGEGRRALGRWLGAYAGASEPPLPPRRPEQFVALASEHLVTPVLHAVAPAGLPPDLADYLAASHTLNDMRNAVFSPELEEIACWLNARDVVPVVLKGGASLLSGLYRSRADRMVTDIDLLVPAHRLDDCVADLHGRGFGETRMSSLERWQRTGGDHHHYPSLCAEGRLFGVELHFKVVSPEVDAVLPAAEVLQRAHPFVLGSACLALPHPAHRLAHNVLHAYSVDRRRRKLPVSLRQLLEFVLLLRDAEADAAWRDVVDRFDRHGLAAHLRDYHGLAGLLLPGALVGPAATPTLRTRFEAAPSGVLVRRLEAEGARTVRRLKRLPRRLRRAAGLPT